MTTKRGSLTSEGARSTTGEAREARRERGRFSAKRKMAAVLRLLRGEDLDRLSRELRVTAATLSAWREGFLSGEQANLKTCQPTAQDEEVVPAQGDDRRPDHAQRVPAGASPCVGGGSPFGPAEVEAMSRTLSPSTSRRYGARMVAGDWEIGRSTLYAARRRELRLEPASKRGPRTEHSDEEPTARFKVDLEASPFAREGHRKVWARLRLAGVRTSGRRVLRLMRQAGLLAPPRQVRVLGPRNHEGTNWRM